jgi:ketosteroid isomerase-like protein
MRLPVLLLLIALGALAPADARAQQEPTRSDSARAVEAVEAFRAALARGDSAAVAAQLLSEAVVLESGGIETKCEYLGHHFHADHAFLENMTREVEHRDVRIEGNAAWVSTTSRMTGSYDGRALDLSSAELIVLRRRRPAGWRVAAVHWSSRSRE